MSSGESGANAYWPGFVDALTNVVIAMIFVVVVLAISLSFAAQMMGKKLAEKAIQQYEAARAASAAAATPVAPAVTSAPLQAAAPTTLKERTRIAVAGNEAASAPRRAGALAEQANLVVLEYASSAVTLDAEALARFKAVAARAGIATRGRALLLARGPDMALSDNQRTAFLRLMAVRNALLEMGVPADRIQVRLDSQTATAQDVVQVSFQD